MPETTSTSCSAGRSSSVTSRRRGAERTTSRSRRAGRTASPGADDLGPQRDAQADLHVRRAELDAVVVGDDLDAGEGLDGAARRRDAGDGLQLREQLLGGGRQLHDEGSLEGEGVIGAVQVCTAGEGLLGAGSACTRGRGQEPWSLSGTAVGSVRAHRRGPCTGGQASRAGRPGRVELDRTRSWASGSAATRSATRRQAWRTVVWLRPPKARPIGRQRRVGVLAHEVHRDLARPGDAGGAAGRQELLARDAEGRGGQRPGSARADGRAVPAPARRPRPRVEAVEHVVGEGGGRAAGRSARRRPRRGSARPRARGRSSSTRSAMRSSTAWSASAMPSCATRLRRTVIRVRRSGGSMSVTRPDSKRSRRRSWSAVEVAGERGRRSARAGCRSSWSALKVWKNSSSVFAFAARNWMSSMRSTSTWR